MALIERHQFTEADFEAAALVGTAFDPDSDYAGASARMMFDSDGVLGFAPHQLLDNANMSEQAGDPTLPAGWTVQTGGVISYTDLGDFDSMQIDDGQTGLRPMIRRSVAAEVSAVYTFGAFINAVTVSSGDDAVVSAHDTSGTDARVRTNIFSDPGWYCNAFVMGASDTSMTLRVGISCNGVAEGSLDLQQPFVIRGLLPGITVGGGTTTFFEELPKDWLGTQNGDSPRYHPRLKSYYYDGAAWNNHGLLFEKAHTNLCLQSEDFATTWTTTGTTVTVNQLAAPDGNTTMDKIIHTTSSGIVSQIQTSAGNDIQVVGSLHVHGDGTHDFVRMEVLDAAGNGGEAWFNVLAGTAVSKANVGTGTADEFGIVDLGGDMYRIWLVATPASGDELDLLRFTNVTADASTTSEETNFTYMWGAEFQAISPLSSYIPTTTAAVTRAAESLDRSFSGDLSAGLTLYSLSMHPIAYPNAADPRIVILYDDSGSSDYTDHRVDSSLANIRMGTVNSGGDNGSISGFSQTYGTPVEVSTSINSTDDTLNAAVDGSLGNPDVTADWPFADIPGIFRIGDFASSAAPILGFITEVAVFDEDKGDDWLINPTWPEEEILWMGRLNRLPIDPIRMM